MNKLKDKYIWKEKDIKFPLCFKCKWLKPNVLCKAFPSGIPKDILTGEFDHTKKYPKQINEIIFEQIKEK